MNIQYFNKSIEIIFYGIVIKTVLVTHLYFSFFFRVRIERNRYLIKKKTQNSIQNTQYFTEHSFFECVIKIMHLIK